MDKYDSPMVAYLGATNSSGRKGLHGAVPRPALAAAVKGLAGAKAVGGSGADVPLVCPVFPALCGSVFTWRVVFDAARGARATLLPDLVLEPQQTALLTARWPELAPVKGWTRDDVTALERLLAGMLDEVAAGYRASLEELSGNALLGLDLATASQREGFEAILVDERPEAWPKVTTLAAQLEAGRAAAGARFDGCGEGALPAVAAGATGRSAGETNTGSDANLSSFRKWAVMHVPLEVDLGQYVLDTDVAAAAEARAADPDVHTLVLRLVYELDNGGLTIGSTQASLIVSSYWVDQLSALTLPTWAMDTPLMDFLPEVEAGVARQLPFLAQSQLLRQDLINALLADEALAPALLEVDRTNYLKIAFLLRTARVAVLATITLPAVFPQQKPSIVFATLGHVHAPPAIGPISSTYDGYPYAPEWDTPAMVAAIKNQLKTASQTFVSSLG